MNCEEWMRLRSQVQAPTFSISRQPRIKVNLRSAQLRKKLPAAVQQIDVVYWKDLVNQKQFDAESLAWFGYGGAAYTLIRPERLIRAIKNITDDQAVELIAELQKLPPDVLVAFEG